MLLTTKEEIIVLVLYCGTMTQHSTDPTMPNAIAHTCLNNDGHSWSISLNNNGTRHKSNSYISIRACKLDSIDLE